MSRVDPTQSSVPTVPPRSRSRALRDNLACYCRRKVASKPAAKSHSPHDDSRWANPTRISYILTRVARRLAEGQLEAMLEADAVAGTFSDSASVRTLVDHIRDCDVIVLVDSGEVIRRPWCVPDLHDAIGAGVHLVALRVTADAAQEATTLNPVRNRGICRLLPFITVGAMAEPAPRSTSTAAGSRQHSHTCNQRSHHPCSSSSVYNNHHLHAIS